MLNEMDLRMSRRWKKKRISLTFFYSSVGIVCMVNPDADNVTSSQSSDPIVSQRNIPAACHEHSVEITRSVDIYFLILI
jgi:hypothetical protein